MNTGWTSTAGSLRHGGPDAASPNGEGRTFVISGVARGGTTLVAAVLREGGLHLGTHMADLVGEDREMLAILQSANRPLLARAVAERNATHRDWGFKLPNIHALLHLEDLARLRNPHLILVFRDPIAIAIRNVVSEYFEPLAALRDSVTATGALLEYMQRARCPTLLVSYEKALLRPAEFVESVSAFCGLPTDADSRARMISHVEPSPEAYVMAARRQFIGAVDVIDEDGILHGWCCQVGELDPVVVELMLDGAEVATATAGRFRNDLLNAGFGNGTHGFVFDLAPFALAPETIVEVRVANRTFAVTRSGQSVADLRRKPA